MRMVCSDSSNLRSLSLSSDFYSTLSTSNNVEVVVVIWNEMKCRDGNGNADRPIHSINSIHSIKSPARLGSASRHLNFTGKNATYTGLSSISETSYPR